MEHRKGYRGIELMKDVLIVLLTISALWLAAQTPLAAPLRGLLREEGRQAAPGQVDKPRAGLHGGEGLRADHVAGLLVKVDMDGDIV